MRTLNRLHRPAAIRELVRTADAVLSEDAEFRTPHSSRIIARKSGQREAATLNQPIPGLAFEKTPEEDSVEKEVSKPPPTVRR